MDKRPSWFSLFHPNLTGGLITIIIFMLLITVGNVFGIYDALRQGGAPEAGGALVSALIYGVPAYGLLQLKRWARLTILIVSIIAVILGFVVMFGASMAIGAFMVVTHGCIAIYLLSERGRRPFYPAAPQPAESMPEQYNIKDQD